MVDDVVAVAVEGEGEGEEEEEEAGSLKEEQMSEVHLSAVELDTVPHVDYQIDSVALACDDLFQ